MQYFETVLISDELDSGSSQAGDTGTHTDWVHIQGMTGYLYPYRSFQEMYKQWRSVGPSAVQMGHMPTKDFQYQSSCSSASS